jgi:choline dehydrogenase-like flavoprotein
MKIDNLTSYPAGSRFEADVVIVGGGPAGLTIAREFTNSEAKILIVESGLETESAAHMEFNRLESGGEPKGEASINFRKIFHSSNMPPFDHDLQPYGVRCRVLGGSAAYWGGKSATFDETYFTKRDTR